MTNPTVSRLAVVGALVLAFQAGRSTPAPAPLVADVLRARCVQLVDAEGRTRAELAIDADGSAGLFVHDERNRRRVALVHDAGQSALYLFDEDGAIRVGAAQYAHGGGGLALHGAEGRGAGVLYLKDGEASLTAYGADGGVAWRVPER